MIFPYIILAMISGAFIVIATLVIIRFTSLKELKISGELNRSNEYMRLSFQEKIMAIQRDQMKEGTKQLRIQQENIQLENELENE